MNNFKSEEVSSVKPQKNRTQENLNEATGFGKSVTSARAVKVVLSAESIV